MHITIKKNKELYFYKLISINIHLHINPLSRHLNYLFARSIIRHDINVVRVDIYLSLASYMQLLKDNTTAKYNTAIDKNQWNALTPPSFVVQNQGQHKFY